MTILLSTLNARYAHASLGLRYLLANMGPLQEQTTLMEFVIGAKTTELVERLLAKQPRIVGFGVYIWNVEETTRVVAMLKRVAPEVVIVLGGPEVSHETDKQEIVRLADYVVTGWGDITFPKLCGEILHGPKPLMKIHAGVQPPMADIQLPYALYSDDDIAHRTIYVEASRGCPFKCEFCLSSLDKTAWPFGIDSFLAEMDSLYARGARLFKFVDRTFNLNVKTSQRIMQFFLEKIAAHPDEPVYAHFELVPDHLPEALKATIAQFPPGALQFEIGIQSFNPEVQTLVSRRQDNAKAAENIRWLTTQSHAHLHVDLIAGLPGEDVDSFARGFDQLVALGPHEIQFGILKRLRGTPIIRHTEPFGMVYDPYPPYTVLATDRIDFATMQRLVRFARYWDLVANSGRFNHTVKALLADSPFASFMAFSDWIYTRTDATHRIALEKLARLVQQWLQLRGMAPAEAAALLASDYAGNVDKPARQAGKPPHSAAEPRKPAAPERQVRHLAA
ncbi:B12-binding domain-containing radical SAM protein [Massilia sp. 9096]|uniref:B12-binding domain-containing radical SAM protein n=1 Tax=Massilia sp. 9096 TaxID=1500894 RepID=UPI00056659A4|nr:B12-binding domain-containing radical SAM protein [Massilia sp. 9096]